MQEAPWQIIQFSYNIVWSVMQINLHTSTSVVYWLDDQ